MNASQKALYDELMELCRPEDSSFYFKDHVKGDITYRIFLYRIASYTEFLKPSALECRGTMFEISPPVQIGEHYPMELVCRPPAKFFNLNENPFTMNQDHSTAIEFMEKADGSLISTFIFKGQLALKTKGSLDAEQVALAWSYLRRPENAGFLGDVTFLTKSYLTVNMEIISPLNRIVLPYSETGLRVLNLRALIDGATYFYSDVLAYKHLIAHWVEREDVLPGDAEHFIATIPSMVDIEGFVVRYASGKLIKVKTEWYQTLHHNKDSINIPRRLFECVINESTDDLRSLFHDDAISLQAIKDMEDMVVPKFNHMVSSVESFFNQNRNLDRKSYAIKGQQELKDYFSLGMMMYLKDKGLKSEGPNFKEFAIKNYKTFGIPDVEETMEVV